MYKFLIRMDMKLNKKLKNSIYKMVEKINKENNYEIKFIEEEYKFKEWDYKNLKKNPNEFLDLRFPEITSTVVNSIIYIPNTKINLYGNYLWYSTGEPLQNVMVISSFLYNMIFKDILKFSSYFLILLSQFLARYAVELEDTHDKSKNCLNDHCTDQIDLLNVLENKKDILCKECKKKIINEGYYEIAKYFIDYVKLSDYKKEKTEVEYDKVEEYKIQKKIEIKLVDGHCYEFEIYMAKKCANISNLYEKLDRLLSNPSSKIDGYSLYEVGGGWRGGIVLSNATDEEWKELFRLQRKYGNNDFKDIIKPLISNKNNKCAVFDETSIVLRIIFVSKVKLYTIDVYSNPIVREIVDIFKDITEKEKSVFFTLKELYKVGNISRSDNGDNVIYS